MRKILFLLIMLCGLQDLLAQAPATVSVPVSLGMNNCNGTGRQDSVYFFNYVSPNLSNNNAFAGCRPVLKTNFAPLSGYSNANKPFTVFNSSIAFNPADQMLYYVWTDYNVASPYKSYIWRWSPLTCPPSSGGGLDTLRTFNTDIGGLTFDANGLAYQLEFQGPAPFKAFLRTVNFTTGVIGSRDTLDLTGGKFLWNVGSGDITLTPSGQMYFVFNNKLFTPDYTDYGNPTHHIKCTYIDTVRAPVAGASLPGLAFGNGDLIASYNNGCSYRRVDPVTGDTAATIYTYPASKGVYSTDMTQINSGVGAAKKLISVTPTGTPNQYTVVYDVYIRNYGNVPITNVQVSDNLAAINGLANVSNVSAVLTSNPAGVTLNGTFNGTTVTNLLAASQNLPCYPVANNNFTIRITCRLSNIQQGIIYNNSAIATANGWRSVALRDSSMNGSVPDLNQNDKPDDVGEGQPTPFLITVTPTTPPCTVLAQTLYTQDFGTGNGMVATLPAVPSATTTYAGTATAPMGINKFTVSINASLPDPTNWISLTDHTGGSGRMMVVNADVAARIVYRDTMPVLCGGQQYSVSFWAAFIGNSTYQTVCDGLGGFKYPMLLVRVRDQATGLVITQYTTDTIKSNSWVQHGMKWVLPTGYSNIILEIVNAGPGGCGNDFALDDIVFGLCDPMPTVAISAPSACLGGSVTFTANVTDPAVVPGTKQYQWQVATALAGPYTNIVGATAATYTINPVLASDTGKYYRVIVAGNGNILIPTCQYISAGVKLSGLRPSVAPTSITATSSTICNPGSATLTAVGGTLGSGANYQWGTGAVAGTNPIPGATNSTLVVSPTTTTTYWVQIQNTTSPCAATTGGVTTVVTVNQPSVAPTSITGPDICNPGSTTLTANGGTLGTGANYQWGTGGVVGTNPIVGATGSTLTVSPTTTTTYWVRIQNTSAPCTAITGGVTKVVTVNQPSVAPTGISVPASTYCGATTVSMTATGGTLGTGANYQWGVGPVVGTNPIAGATGPALVINVSTTTTFWVRIENTSSPCTAMTGGVTTTITIRQPSTPPSGINGSGYCNPGSTTLSVIGGVLGTGANFQWGTGAVPGTNPIAGATGPAINVSPTTTTTYWVRIENTAAPCPSSVGGVTTVVTVTQPSVAPTSITAPSSTFCGTATTTLTAVGGTLGTGANYQWGTGSVVGTNPIAGATSSTLNISVSATTTYWVRIENTASPCTATTGGTTLTVTVNQPSVAPTSITGSDYCNPGSTTLTAIGGTLGTGANYQWGTGSVVGTNPIAGATSSTLLVSPTTTTTYWVRIENTTAPCTAITGGVTKVITVYQPSVAPTSISATASTICNPGSVTLTANGGTLGTGANYQWGTGAVIGTNPIAGATGSTLTVSPTTTTTYWVQVQNTSTPCVSTTGGVTTVITVNQPSVAPTSITGSDYCNPGSTTLTAIGGTLGTGANYQWGTGAVVGTNPIAGATSSTLLVSPTTTTTYWVRIENTTAPCTAITGGVTKVVTVYQPSSAPTSISATASTICNPGSVTLTAVGGTLGTGANYQWGTGAIVGTNPIAGATNSTLTVSPTTTTTYWVRIQNTTAPCAATTGGVTTVVTVNQPSVAPTSITGSDYCNPGSTTLTAIGGTLGTGANYQWGTGAVVGTNPIAGATSSTLLVSPTTTTTYWVRIENTTAPCTAITGGVTKVVTVYQPSSAPTSISAPSSTFCGSATTTLTAVGGTLGTGANYQWGTGAVVGTNPIAGATGSTLNINISTTTTYWVRIENTTSPCAATTGGTTLTITINQGSVAPTSITGADYCNPGSTTLTAIGGTLGTGANYQWGTGSVVGTNPIAGATNSTLLVSPTTTTTYWVRIENTTAPCTAITGGVTKVITVYQPSVAPTAITAPATTICNPGSVTLTATGGTLGTGANYQWGTGSVIGTNPIAGATNATLTVSPTTTTTYWVRIENTASPCAATTGGTTVTITVNQPSVAPTSITAPSSTFCGSATTTLTAVGGTLGTAANYQWGTGSVVGTNPIAGATGSTLNISISTTTTYWVRIENTAGPCAATTGGTTVTITINQGSVAPTSITGADYCNPGSTTLIAIGGTLGTGANYQWGTGSVVGTNPIAGATSSTLLVSPTTTTTYWVRIENTTAPCTAITGGVTKVVTVYQPSVAPTSITAPATTICTPSSVTLTAVGGTLGTGANYQWGTGSVVGTNPIAGATNSTLTVSPTTTTTYWVRIENTTSPCAATTGGTTTVITVNQPSTAPTSITGADYCNPGSTTLTAIGGTLGSGANYQWGTGSVVGTNPIAGATNSTLTVSPTTTTTYWVRIESTSAPCSAITGGVTKVVTVYQPSSAPTSISAPSSTFCGSASTTLTAVGGTLGTGANYQWGTGSIVGTNPIAGATGSTLNISISTTTTYWVRIENTTSPCAATTGGTTLTVTINQPSTAPASITGADYCNPGSTTLTAVGGTLGTGANYQWGTGSVVGTNPIAGATNATLTVSPTTTTTYWVRIENTTAPCTAITGGVTKVVTVYQPSVAPTSITAPATTICTPGSVTLTANGGTLGTGANYQWGTGSVVGTNPIAGATSSTLTVSPTSTTTYWVRIQNTSAPCAATTGGVTTVISVNQPSTAPTSITGTDYCNPGSATLTAIGGTLGSGANYQWGTGAVVGTNPIAGATNATLTVSPTTTTTYWVRIESTTAPCSAITGGVTKVVTVYQPSVAPASISAPSTTFCSSATTTLTATGGTLGTGANYQWGTGSVVGTNPIAGATNSTLAISAVTTTTTYWVRIENTTSPCAATTGGTTLTVTINQPSAAPTSITGADYCNPGSATLTAIGGTLGTGANYQWGTGGVVGTNPIAGATSSTLTVSPTTTTTYWVRIQNTTAPCTAITGGVTKVVTVYQPSVAPASITAPSTTFCNSATTTLTAAGGTLGTGANYQWGTGSVVGTNPIAGATNSTLAISAVTTTTTYWVRIENTASPCAATTGGTTLTVNINQSSAAPSSITGANFCNPGSTTLTAIGGTLGTGANYQWGTGGVVGTNPIAGATSSTLTVSPTTTTTYWVRIQNTTAPCTATTGGVTKVVTVYQPSVGPASISAPSTAFCNSGTVTLTAAGGTLGTGANYQWGTGSVPGTNPIAGATNATLLVSGLTTTTTYWVRIENTTSPCAATTGGATTVITINQSSAAPTSVTGTGYCSPGSTTLTAVGGTLGTNANYQWGTGAVVGTNPIAGATAATLTVSPTTTTTYWVRIENTTAPCTANTSGLTRVITVTQPSVAATAAARNKNNICPGISVALSVVGGTLGTGASWKWYTGSCGGTLVGTGATINVTPSVTTTYYVLAEGSCNTTTCQSVTVNINCDIDKDKDGIPDFVESAMSAAFADANSNGVINAYDVSYAGFVDNNYDYINDNFQADGDSDNDGVPNYLDPSFPGRVDANGDGVDDRFDADGDGIINMLDLDSDNDGIPDTVEAYGVDTNGDGKIDNFTDTDNDGLSQNVDINNTGASNTGQGLGNIDLDGDGYPNFIDLDSDGDGIPDLVETGGTDTNNDGRPDGLFVDANGDGLHDSYINGGAILLSGADADNNGRADSWPNKNFDMDLRPNAYDLDADGDGLVDVVEAGLPDANLDGRADGTIGTNGWSTTISVLNALALSSSDNDGKPDYLDIDSDADGIPDNIEGQTTSNYKLPTIGDADGDGIATVYDNTPAAYGGMGIFPYDHDFDGTPDYLDLDTDGDGQPDIVEGNDFNLDGKANDNITPTGLDTDGDGLDNRFDSLNSGINRKGTSYMMGNGGGATGDGTPGARCPVQKKTPGQIDRDWRFVGSVLPVDILSFSGVLQSNTVNLKWTIVASKEVDRFEIERSLDNSRYDRVSTVPGPVELNRQQNFTTPDYISNIPNEILYYRLKVIGKAGEIKYSNVLVIRRTQTKTLMALMPNPARDNVTVRFYAEKESEVIIRLIDNLGKIVLVQRSNAGRGNNSILVSGLGKYSAGVYSLQMMVNDEIVTEKLMIVR